MKTKNPTPLNSRHKFDESFKREAVQNWLHSGKSAYVIAQELGFTASLLYASKRLFACPANPSLIPS